MSEIKTYTNRHGREFQCQTHEVFERLKGSGIYQVSNLRYLRDLVPNARRIIDVGANVGIMTMEYATWAKRVEAFEAQASTFELLERNIEHNKTLPLGKPWYEQASTQITGKITTHRVALMDRPGTALTTERADGLASFVSFDKGQEPVPARTIDSYQWQDVDAIKIDTEGTEWLIVQGAKQTIERCRPVLQIEFWDWERRFGLNNQEMLDYFKSINYDQRDCLGRPLPWDNPRRYTKKLGRGRSAMDRFFIPL